MSESFDVPTGADPGFNVGGVLTSGGGGGGGTKKLHEIENFLSRGGGGASRGRPLRSTTALYDLLTKAELRHYSSTVVR